MKFIIKKNRFSGIKRKTSITSNSKLQPMIDEIKSWSNTSTKKLNSLNDVTTDALIYLKSPNSKIQFSSYSSCPSSRSSSGNNSPVNEIIGSKNSLFKSESPMPGNSAFGAFRRLCN